MADVGLAEFEDEEDRARDRNGAEQLGDQRERVERRAEADAAEDQGRLQDHAVDQHSRDWIVQLPAHQKMRLHDRGR
jgi:hypothetical protein